MKNLKRALSLVLSAAMMVGMMVVGTSAHSDVTAEHNVEAIEVVSAAGIMGANEDFNPDGKITRNEMAVVMVNLLGLKTADYKGASQFADVPAWAADYVDACFANGIVSGVSATEFNGNANVTTAEAALMVMKALGYFQYSSDFGADWLLATVKQASKINLLKDIDAAAKAALTRNEVAQLVLNALKATMVEPTDNGIGLDAAGNLVSKYQYVSVENAELYADDIFADAATGSNYYVQLGEKLFKGDLKLNAADAASNADDAFGRDVSFWNYKGDDVVTSTVTPTYEFVVTSTTGTKATLEGQLKALNKNTQFTNAADNNGDSNSIVYVNGLNMTSSAYTPAKGDIVEVYCATNDKTDVLRVVVREYKLAKITKVDNDVNTTDANNDVTAYIDLNTNATAGADVSAMHDTAIAGFDAKTYVKDAYIAAAWDNAGTTIIDSYIVTPVEGTVSAYTANTNYTVGGTKYEAGRFISGYNAYASADYEGTYAFYLDENGYILGVEVVKATQVVSDAVYVLAMYAVDGSATYGKNTKEYYAQTVDMTGVIKNEKIGYTTSTGKFVGVAADGYTYDAVASALTAKSAVTTSHYYVDATTGLLTQARNNTLPTAAVGYNAGGANDAAKLAGVKFYTRDTQVINASAGNLYTVTENTTDKLFELAAYTGTSTIKIGTEAGETGYVTTDTKTGTLSAPISAPAYLTANTKYIVVEGTLDAAKAYVKTGADVSLTVASTTITVIANKVGTSYEAAYIILPTATYTAGIENERLYVASTTASDVKEGKKITAYKMDGTTVDIVVTATEYTNDVAANKFYTYSVNDKGVYDLNDIGEITISSSHNWDKNTSGDKGAVLDATFTGMYNNTISLTDSNALYDIAADKAVIVDKHEAVQAEFETTGLWSSGEDTYAGKVTTLEAMASVTETGYTITFSTSITENGVQFIYIREISK